MGIKNLLQFLSSSQRDVNISSFRGQTVAVDAYCWLHKGAYSCAMQLVMKSERCENLLETKRSQSDWTEIMYCLGCGEDGTCAFITWTILLKQEFEDLDFSFENIPFVRYCMKRIHLLRQNEITPIVVFDGAHLPMKSNTEKERRERRFSYLQKGKALLKDGRQSEAVDCFQKCVDVSPEMALTFIKELRKCNVQVVVAPYEADAQLAYLVKEGIAQVVITEDSDLLAFGCKKVFFKMNDSGDGKLIEFENIGKSVKSLIGFTPDSFRHVCILSGCDYLPSVPGIGPATAVKLMRKYNKNPYNVIKGLKKGGGDKVPPGYEETFKKADETFLYQIVFDPRTQTQVRLNTAPTESELSSVGIYNSPSKQLGLARGNINPLTMEVMDTFSPSKTGSPSASLQSSSVHLKPIKSSSWSVMNSSGSSYPIKKQSTITVSHRARKEYKRPLKTREENDEGTTEEDLRAMYGGESADTTSTSQTGITISCISSYQEGVIDTGGQVTGVSIFAKGTCRSKYFTSDDASVKKSCMSTSPGLLKKLNEDREVNHQFSSEEAINESYEKPSSLDSGIDSLPPDVSSPMSSDENSLSVGFSNNVSSKKRLNFDSLERDETKRMKLTISEEELIINETESIEEETLPASKKQSKTDPKTESCLVRRPLRLGLPRRSSGSCSSSNILSYFSYKGKEKLKH